MDNLRKQADMTNSTHAYGTRAQRAKSVAERFWEKVDKTDTCWLWAAAADTKGYGVFDRQGAHRWAFETLIGPIPDGLVIDHLCRVRNCVNVAHMELVTNEVNVLRGVGPFALNKRKTHCGKGHEFTPVNTRTDRRGNRNCRACDRDRKRRNRGL